MKIRKIKIPKQILFLLLFSLILNLLRVFVFNTTTFIYLFWNIFLAFVPFFISYVLFLRTNKNNITKPFFIIGFILWFLFLPNAPYVVTDFIHLGRIYTVPVMYDIFLLASASYVSLMFGLYSLIHMEKILNLRFSNKNTNIIIAVIILFCSFGIYLGRFLRFNSWDFFINHKFLISSIYKVSTSGDGLSMYAYTILFFTFIYIAYISFKTTYINSK